MRARWKGSLLNNGSNDGEAVVDARPGVRTAVAAAGYTIVAAAQKASGFILLIAFTRVLTPSEYGQVALLTTVGALLTMSLSLGLESRITYTYFRAGDDLPDYLRTARRISIWIPVGVAMAAAAVIGLSPIALKGAWVMECVGSCLLAAGTTYAYSVLRAARRVMPYMMLALTILVTQVATRVVMVAFLDAGPSGWAASDLAGGVVAVIVSSLIIRRTLPKRSPRREFGFWRVLLEGLPLVPHYLAQWGLSLSDRLILVLFVTTAEVGFYAALYQIAAVTSLVLNEVNRAFMPMYARNAPGSPALPGLVRNHLRVTFALHGTLLLFGFAAIEVVLPDAYQAHDELFPMLTLGALAYGLYFVPMNALTLVAGRTSGAPLISVTALAVNLVLNLALDSIWGLWGAVIGTALGYSALAGIALYFETRTRAIPWRAVFARQRAATVGYASAIILTAISTQGGPLRALSLAAVACLVLATALSVLNDRRRHTGLRHQSIPES